MAARRAATAAAGGGLDAGGLDLAWSAWSPPPEDIGRLTPDPLGLFVHAERLADELCPGITSRTWIARYYGMVCWGLRLVEREHARELAASPERDAGRVEGFLRWEKLYSLAVLRRRRDLRGVLGGNKARSALDRQSGADAWNLDYEHLDNQAFLGALGAYKTSLRSLGFLHEDALELTAAGDELAKAFFSLIDDRWKSRCERWLANGLRNGRAVDEAHGVGLSFVGDRLPLDQTSPGERALLRRHLFEAPGSERRRAVLAAIAALPGRWPGEAAALRALAAGAGPAAADVADVARTIVALEDLTTAVEHAFDHLRAGLGALGLQATRSRLLAAMPGFEAAVAEARRVVQHVRPLVERDALRPAGERVFEGLGAPEALASASPGAALDALLSLHQRVMRGRGGRQWVGRRGDHVYLSDPSLALDGAPRRADWRHTFRLENLRTLARSVEALP